MYDVNHVRRILGKILYVVGSSDIQLNCMNCSWQNFPFQSKQTNILIGDPFEVSNKSAALSGRIEYSLCRWELFDNFKNVLF